MLLTCRIKYSFYFYIYALLYVLCYLTFLCLCECMFADTVYVLYDVCFILVIVGFKSSVDLVFVYVYHAPILNKAFCCTLYSRLFVKVRVLFSCEKLLQDSIILLGRLGFIIIAWPCHFLLKFLYQARKVSGHVYVWGVSIFPCVYDVSDSVVILFSFDHYREILHSSNLWKEIKYNSLQI